MGMKNVKIRGQKCFKKWPNGQFFWPNCNF